MKNPLMAAREKIKEFDRPNPPIVNIDQLDMRAGSKGTRFAVKAGRIGGVIGMQQLGAQYFVVPPGKAAYPRHAHHANEEFFIILEGAGEYRVGRDIWPVRAGDLIAAPAGDAGTAHQLRNTSTTDIRYIVVSTRNPIDVTEYPDSGKVMVAAGIPPGKGMVSAALTHTWRKDTPSLDYYDGEDTGEDE